MSRALHVDHPIFHELVARAAENSLRKIEVHGILTIIEFRGVGQLTKDIRSFIDYLRNNYPDEIQDVEQEVNPVLEISAILGKLERLNRYPLLYFKKVKGSKVPLVINMSVGYRRLAMAMGLDSNHLPAEHFSYTDELAAEYLNRKANLIAPVKVDNGPCKEVVKKGTEVDLNEFPIPTFYSEDAGPYITAGITVSRDPEKPEFPKFNLGIYRHMLISKNRIGLYYSWGKYMHYLHKKAEDKKEAMDIAILIGYHPALYFASTDQSHLSEYSLAGAYMKEPVPLVKCETNDIYVPANAEIVLEGKILPNVRQKEGPFGEAPGYYGQIVNSPVVEINCITHRHDPIYYAAPGGRHYEHMSGGIGHVFDMLVTLRKYFPTVKKIHRSMTTGSVGYTFVQIKKMNEGDPVNIGLMALAMNKRMKHAVVVDEDVNIFDEREVMWAIATRARADEDYIIIPRAKGNRLDPTTYNRLRTSRDGMVTMVVIDATTKTGLPYEIPQVIKEPMIDSINLADFGIR